MGRECKNYYLQESVGATTARAFVWLMKAYKRYGMKSEVMVTLYDSILTLGPLNERFAVNRLHDLYICELNTWDYDGRILRFGIDTDFNYAWSSKPDKAKKAQLADPTWHPTPEHLLRVVNLPRLVS